MINSKTKKIVQLLIKKSKKAQINFQKYNQKQVDEVVTAVAWALCNPVNNKFISTLAVNSTTLGNIDDKILKNKRKTLGLLRDLKKTKSVGIIKNDKKKGIIEIAKPIGVIGAIDNTQEEINTEKLD
ncbi:hypothetical protein N9O00_00605 [Candidatus Pelagibacter ubique]|nr:hypothetical protein [Candidatus Pelagibacter ubique]